MKASIYKSALVVALLALPFMAPAAEVPSLELEPCINGAVSASGLYPSQAAENEHRQRGVRVHTASQK